MTQYNTVNLKLSNSQLNKLKSGMKNGTQETLKLLSNVILTMRLIFNISYYNWCTSFEAS